MSNVNDDNTSQYNLDELHAPSWLNKEFLTMVLKQHENNDNLKLENFEIKPGTGKCDHYASVIFRVKIVYQLQSANEGSKDKSTSWIIKTTPEQEGIKMDMLQDTSLFKNEIIMYGEILPIIDQQLKTIGDSSQFYPKMIYSSRTPRECLIFEDLAEKGYTVISKRDSTINEVHLTLEKLARLHAVSYKIFQEGDTKMTKLQSPLSRNTLKNLAAMSQGITNLKELLASSTDDLRMYVKYVEKIEKTLLDDVADLVDSEEVAKRGGILVMTHGDFHARNTMLQYNGDILTNILLIDFQASCYGSAVLDLIYASVSLLSPEMRMNMQIRDEIFSKYIETFQAILRKLNFAGHIPTKSDFEAEWKRYKRWELFLHTSHLAFSYAVRDGEIPISDLIEKDEVRQSIWRNENLINELRMQMPRLLKNGVLD